jgi:hypothetical protein
VSPAISGRSRIEIVEQIAALRIHSHPYPMLFSPEGPVRAMIEPELKAAIANALMRLRRWKFSFAASRSL